MGALRGYHGFNNWRKMVVEEESDYIDRTICFGFELEINKIMMLIVLGIGITIRHQRNLLMNWNRILEIYSFMKEMVLLGKELKLFHSQCL